MIYNNFRQLQMDQWIASGIRNLANYKAIQTKSEQLRIDSTNFRQLQMFWRDLVCSSSFWKHFQEISEEFPGDFLNRGTVTHKTVESITTVLKERNRDFVDFFHFFQPPEKHFPDIFRDFFRFLRIYWGFRIY